VGLSQANRVSIAVTDQELYDTYRGFAFAVAFRMRRSYRLADEDAEDIASTALAFLLQSRPKIDFSQNGGEPFCKRVILNASLNALKQLRKHGSTISLDEPVDNDDGVGSNLHDLIADERMDTEGDLLAKESRHIAKQYLKQRWHRLTPEYQMLLTRVFGLDGNEPVRSGDLATELDESSKNVRYKINNALKKLRRGSPVKA
jgi:DNA-directed RNA polymerase specialized sigma24 family protein